LVEHVQRSEVEQTAVPIGVRILIERPVHLHKAVFSAAVIFGVVADAINEIGVVVQRPSGVMFEMVVVAGFGPLIGWRNVVGHCLLRPRLSEWCTQGYGRATTCRPSATFLPWVLPCRSRTGVWCRGTARRPAHRSACRWFASSRCPTCNGPAR